MPKRDYYDILGVSRGAASDAVKKAYRKLARQYHPDVAKDKKTAEAKMKELNEAYAVLSNSQKKQAYDQFGHAAFDQTAGFGQPFNSAQGQTKTHRAGPFTYTYTTGGGLGDLFGEDPESIFDLFFGAGAGRPRKGRDLHLGLGIRFADAVKGAEREISVGRRRLKIKIPAGAQTGTELRFAGEGAAASQKGAPAGDLFLHLEVGSHPLFRRVGADVWTEVEINLVTAVLGGVVEVPVVDPPEADGRGTAKLKIPPGTQPGAEFRLRGKGMPRLRGPSASSGLRPPGGSGRGNCYIRIRVKIPQKLTREQRGLWEKFRKAGR
ncbi:J domain-containing protein [Candidatus Parcubacteria bacterium]|nr:J domain-containing protein [Candidatus Parcubacteria bacterium]